MKNQDKVNLLIILDSSLHSERRFGKFINFRQPLALPINESFVVYSQSPMNGWIPNAPLKAGNDKIACLQFCIIAIIELEKGSLFLSLLCFQTLCFQTLPS